jgi:hypothetical protein
MIDEGDHSSIQYEMKLRGLKSVRKDDLRPIIIDFHVPALTPHLSSIENSP